MLAIYLQLMDTDEEKDKFTAVYERYRGKMFLAANRILHNHADSEDAVHEAFIYILNNLPKIEAVPSPKTEAYCVIIAQSRALDKYEKLHRQETLQIDEELVAKPAEEQSTLLTEALDRLPLRFKTIIYLRYYIGYKIREIAPMLNMTETAAQRMLTRAKDALEEKLEELRHEQ